MTQVTTATPAKEIRIESSFEGISLSIFNGKSQCLVHTAVTGRGRVKWACLVSGRVLIFLTCRF